MMSDQIILLDKNMSMCKAWDEEFGRTDKKISVVNSDFGAFIEQNEDVDGIVSPANSFGIMDGGYDAAITAVFGQGLMNKVQDRIFTEFGGIQPVGSALSVPIDDKRYLIHVPTMMYPGPILDIRVIYQSMRSTLCAADKLNIKKIVIPAFGRLTGRVDDRIVAKMMRLGYEHSAHVPKRPDWEYVTELARQIV